MSNTEIIDESIKLYFDGKDWLGYVKRKVKEKRQFKELLENLV